VQTVIVVLAAAADSKAADSNERAVASAVTDILWAFADPQECLEHISSVSGKSIISIVLFYLADDPETATQRAYRLCRRAISGSPGLRGWQVRSITGQDISGTGYGSRGS
jgi:hypothetical protein